MGLMRFIFPPGRITEEMAQQAYLTGYDRVPWQVEVRRSGEEMVLQRGVSESGVLHIPWPVDGHGVVTLQTGTLMERPDPYYLPLELARGKVGQVRGQLADWESLGLEVPKKIHDMVAEAVAYFSQATVAKRGSPRSARVAEHAIESALDAGTLLADVYTQQAIAVRRHLAQKLPTFLGADLGTTLLDEHLSREYLETFNAAGVPFSWQEIEPTEGTFRWDIADKQVKWSSAHKLTVCGGPLLRFDKYSLPSWLYLYEGDFDSLADCVSSFVKALVTRYRGKVDVWQCAGRVNTPGILGLSEEAKIKLTARVLEIVGSLDRETATVVSFDQPWGEYLRTRELDFPPLHFADALVRSGLGMTGVMLEINAGYPTDGTMPRDLLDMSRHLDHWSQLGVPLYTTLAVPSSTHDDPLARRHMKLPPDSWTPKSQADWVARYIPLMLAKSYIQGILWNPYRDHEPHEFPHSGLFDLRRHPKPALRQLASIRKAHLK